MAEIALSRRLLMRLIYLALAMAIILFHLLPLNTHPRAWAPPDLLLALTFAWTMRRPDYVPLLSVALVMFLADLLFQRPPGLMAALVVLGADYLRGRVPALRGAGFGREWLTVGLTITAILIASRAVTALFGVTQAQLSLALMQLVLTFLAYPVVVLVSRTLFGVRRLSMGDAARLGGNA